jgi:hypothetical protein
MKASNAPEPIIVTVGHLKKSGLFRPDRLNYPISIGKHITANRTDDRNVFIKWRNEQSSPDHVTPNKASDGWQFCVIRIIYRARKFGKRPYFICPSTGQDCLKLVLYGNIAASLRTFKSRAVRTSGSKAKQIQLASARSKLLKLDGGSRIGPLRRADMINALESHRADVEREPGLSAFLQQEGQRKARERGKWLREQRPVSTTKAIDCGRGAFQHSDYEEYLRADLEHLEQRGPELIDLSEMMPPDSIEFYPALDVRVLLARGFLKGDSVRGRILGWSPEATHVRRITMFDDGRHPRDRELIFRIDVAEQDDPTWQRIQLVCRGSFLRPRYLLCPVLMKKCDILYFRGGRFASRKAQALYNPSQRADGRRKLEP